VGFVLVPEVLQCRQHRVGGGAAQGAEGRCLDLLAEILQSVEIFRFPVARCDPVQDIEHLLGPFTAGNAFPAGFPLGELKEELRRVHHAVRFV